MSGYYGYKMSNNAVAAYEAGEKPLSKWTKKAILNEIMEIYGDAEKIDIIKKLNSNELKEYFLIPSSWHHTSKFYNKTYFYVLDIDFLNNVEIDFLLNIMAKRSRKKRTKEEIQKEKEEKEKRAASRKEKEEKEKLFKYQKKYKTLKGFLRSNTDFEKLKTIRKKAIEEKRTALKEAWTRQNFKRGLDNVNDDDFIEKYI